MSTRCLTPIHIRHKIKGDWQEVPCSKCPNCLKRRISGWSFRLVKEGERSTSALFITLTYNTDHIPISPNGFMTLNKPDLQKFFKRLRKLSNAKLKYYSCGEYGTKHMRPHYHIILFNADINHVERAWALDNKKIGEIHCGEVSEASIGYTLKYVCKPKTIPRHARDDRIKEFSLMSKKMGENYLTENMIKWHKNDLINRMYIPMKDGKKIAMPRYFKERIYSLEEKKSITKRMQSEIKELDEQERQKHGDKYEKHKLEIVLDEFRKMYKNNKRKDQ